MILTRCPAVAVPKAESEPASSRVEPPLILAVTPLPTLTVPVVAATRSVPPLTFNAVLSPSCGAAVSTSVPPPDLAKTAPPPGEPLPPSVSVPA